MSETIEELAERLSRVVKIALDTGEASNEEDALAIFRRYKVQLVFGPELSEIGQAALLTAAATAVQCMLGGVAFVGPDQPLRAHWHGHPGEPLFARLYDALLQIGARDAGAINPAIPVIAIGHPGSAVGNGVRATFDGWTAAAVPLDEEVLPERGNCAAAGVLAGALAVAEVFQKHRGTQPLACARSIGFSLWDPSRRWRAASIGPGLTVLPQSAWLVGLGNLGQAYLWTLGLLPYKKHGCHLLLQDFDNVSKANVSTSLLSRDIDVGRRKTRVLAEWAERRGFRTSLVERPFGPNFTVASDEPPVALIGVDNAAARRMVERVGFTRIIDAGLGKGASDFLGMTMHTFPATRAAEACWQERIFATERDTSPGAAEDGTADRIAYRRLKEQSGDNCGVLRLADRSIATPFAGAVAGAIVIGELLRLCHGGARTEYVSMHLGRPNEVAVIPGAPWQVFNPGTVAIELSH